MSAIDRLEKMYIDSEDYRNGWYPPDHQIWKSVPALLRVAEAAQQMWENAKKSEPAHRKFATLQLERDIVALQEALAALEEVK